MKVMSVIHFLVRLEVVVAVISGHDDVLHFSHGADAVPDDPQDCGQSPVQSQEVFVLQHGADGVPAQRGVEGGGEAGPGVEGQQQLQGGGANDAALRQGGHRGQEEGESYLIQRGEDGELVMARPAECPAMVQVYGEGLVAEQFERLVVVTVHVAHEEVEDGEVHQVEESPALVVRTDVLDCVTVVRVILPLGFASLVVAPSPGVAPRLARHQGLAGQEGGQADLQHVGTAADGV